MHHFQHQFQSSNLDISMRTTLLGTQNIYSSFMYAYLIDLIFSFLMVFVLFQSDIYRENCDVLKFLVYKSQKYSSNGLKMSQYCIILIKMGVK